MPDATMSESAIFRAAVLLSPEQRAEFLARACGDNAELRREVESLLAAHEPEGSFLEAPAAAVTIDRPLERPGTQIGPYKLLEQIGEGGMGTVFVAQQSEPIKRLVALKIIKPGMDSRQVIARFEAERQALALMDHPNIAKVLDAGTTAAGRPYFVMELVKGVPITQYCDQHRLTPQQRLELFVPVCQAIQHAHQKGIIHRDLKPSNVLVALYDDEPVPKVIDFGVAKATGQQLTEQTLHTGFGAVVGTLEYMSPEQATFNQFDVDTRSDIYSLGVLLYELLAGSPPFSRQNLEEAGLLEMLRVIREQEPSKPSTKLSSSDALPTLSANRGTEPARLAKQLRGELDWIVMKALDKDRARRYETASSLAADLQHYLNDEPVVACPPSTAYRFAKFARRNKAVLATVLIVAATLVLGIVGTSWQAIRAMNAEAAANSEARRATRESEKAQQQEQKAIKNLQLATNERKRAEDALKVVTAEQARAEGNLDLALKALDAVYLDAIGTDKLLGPMAVSGMPGLLARPKAPLTDVEKQLLQRGLAFYDQFAQQNAKSSRAAAQTAQAYFRVGLIQVGLGDSGAAEAALQAAIERFEKLTKEEPKNSEHWRQLADARSALSGVTKEWSAAKVHLALACDAYTSAIAQQGERPGLYLARANNHFRLGKFAAAIADVSVALRLAPDDPGLNKDAAYLYWAAKYREGIDSAKALPYIERAIQLDPDDPDIMFIYARLLAGAGSDPQRALDYYNRVAAVRPKSVDVLTYRSMHLFDMGNVEAGRRDLDLAATLEAANAADLIHRAAAHAMFNRFDEAHADLTKAAAIAPNITELHRALADLYLREGNYQLALEEATLAATIEPTSATVYKRRAAANFFLGRFRECLLDLETTRKLDPHDLSTLTWVSPALVAKCPDEAFKSGLLKLADEAVEKNPAARSYRAVIAMHVGQWEKARADIAELLKGDKARHYDYYQLAMISLADHRNLESYGAACRGMLTKFAESKNFEELNFTVWTAAIAPQALDDYGPAIALAQRGVEMNKDNPEAIRSLGAILYRARKYEEAAQQLAPLAASAEKASPEAKSSAAYPLFFLAMAQHQLGKKDEARTSLQRAVEMTKAELADEKNPPSWNRKLTLELLRQEAEALLEIPTAPAPEPNHSPTAADSPPEG